jgi:hypothetical protein
MNAGCTHFISNLGEIISELIPVDYRQSYIADITEETITDYKSAVSGASRVIVLYDGKDSGLGASVIRFAHRLRKTVRIIEIS